MAAQYRFDPAYNAVDEENISPLLTALLCGPLLFAHRPLASTTDAQELFSGLQSDVSVDENVLLLVNRSRPASANIPLIQKSPLDTARARGAGCLLNRLNSVDSQ